MKLMKSTSLGGVKPLDYLKHDERSKEQMSKSMCRGNGLYQWDARVAAVRSGEARRVVNITVFSDSRDDAVHDACEAVEALGFAYPTVDHIVRIGK